jgi:hypothetical protein
VIEIRSYRRVFDLERRIYRVDGLRLNPSGVPVRAAVYFLAVLVACVFLRGVPLLGALVSVVPWYVRNLAFPIVGAAVLSAIRIEGRPFHQAAGALFRYRAGPRLFAGHGCRSPAVSGRPGARWYPGELTMLPDGSDANTRRLRYTGPGAVLVAVAHRWEPSTAGTFELARRPGRLTLHQCMDMPPPPSGQVIVLEPAAQLHVR